MGKYTVRFCNCGRVHFIENEKLDNVLESGKSALHICNHCGSVTEIWLEDNGDGSYNFCSVELKDQIIDDLSKYGIINMSLGERVVMMTGSEATANFTEFVDFESVNEKGISNEEFEKMRRTVNTKATINMIRDKEKCEALSCYCTNINWLGTEFEKEWHK